MTDKINKISPRTRFFTIKQNTRKTIRRHRALCSPLAARIKHNAQSTPTVRIPINSSNNFQKNEKIAFHKKNWRIKVNK